MDYPHVPAAFINAIADEGTKDEAIAWLQKQWNETCALRAALENARRDIFAIAPKRGSRSPLRKVAEEAAMNIAIALGANQ